MIIQKQQFLIVNEPHYIRRMPERIESSALPLSLCLHCDSPLSPGFSLIPLNEKQKVRIPGLKCKKCNLLFVKDAKPINQILQDNFLAQDFSLNGYSFKEYFLKKKQKAQKQKELEKREEEQSRRLKEIELWNEKKDTLLSKVDSGVLLVTLKSKSEKVDCIITNKKPDKPGALAFCYTSIIAREILTAIYHSPRNIQLNGKEYKIFRTYPNDKFGNPTPLQTTIKPSEVTFKKGCGYYSYKKNPQEELVDILLFSPRTQRYEVAHAAYNHETRKCYMDPGIFRAFLQKYGKPNIPFRFHFSKDTLWKNGYDNLKEESVLMEYGYQVSEKGGLTTAERHELLKELVDAELLTVSEIVYLLDFFIKHHPKSNYYDAREKWESDKRFISEYKVNPQRFLTVLP